MTSSFYREEKFIKSSPERVRVPSQEKSSGGLFRKMSPKKQDEILNKMKKFKKLGKKGPKINIKLM